MNLIAQSKTIQNRSQTYRLAQNLMETLLSLPEDQAKALEVADSAEWTAGHHYKVKAEWTPYATNPHFETLTIEYQNGKQSLIKLVTLTPHHSL